MTFVKERCSVYSGDSELRLEIREEQLSLVW